MVRPRSVSCSRALCLCLHLSGEAYQRWRHKLHERRLSRGCRWILREEARLPRLTPMNAWDRCYLAATEQDRLESWLCAQAEAAPGCVPSLLASEPTPPDALREGGAAPRPKMTKGTGRPCRNASVVTRLRQPEFRATARAV